MGGLPVRRVYLKSSNYMPQGETKNLVDTLTALRALLTSNKVGEKVLVVKVAEDSFAVMIEEDFLA